MDKISNRTTDTRCMAQSDLLHKQIPDKYSSQYGYIKHYINFIVKLLAKVLIVKLLAKELTL